MTSYIFELQKSDAFQNGVKFYHQSNDECVLSLRLAKTVSCQRLTMKKKYGVGPFALETASSATTYLGFRKAISKDYKSST